MPVLALAGAGCGSSHATSGTGGTGGAGGNPSLCPGQCESATPDFEALYFRLWSGPIGSTPPTCPPDTPVPNSGFLDVQPAVTCSGCTCSPSGNACFPPEAITANNTACPASGGGVVLGTPAVWDGSCATLNQPVAADSLTASTVLLGAQSACEPSVSTASNIQGGGTAALTCTSPMNVPGGACAGGDVCAYAKTDGFTVCVANFYDDVTCPAGWPVPHTYYDDSRLCVCSCGAPTGASCAATVTAYADSACANSLGSTSVSSESGGCFDVSSGSTVGSVSASPLTYTAGTCSPTLTKTQSWKLCCLE
jgi:hypothetical protein